jgi:1-acyl-sn-glycerol-3-phosphate acyltransferase
MLYEATHALAKVLFKLYFNLTIVGIENVPKTGGVIVAPNHKSGLDIPIVGRALPRKMYTLAKKELFTNKIIAWYLKTMGGIPLKRNAADIDSLRLAINVLKEGKPLLMFPEGTRSETDKLGVPKKGFIFISYKAKAPILPTGLAGTNIALPKKGGFPKPKHIVIVFGKPIRVWEIFDPRDKNFYDNASQYVMNEIKKCVEIAQEKL